MFKIGDKIRVKDSSSRFYQLNGTIICVDSCDHDIADIRFDDGRRADLYFFKLELATTISKCKCGATIPKDKTTCCDCLKRI